MELSATGPEGTVACVGYELEGQATGFGIFEDKQLGAEDEPSQRRVPDS